LAPSEELPTAQQLDAMTQVTLHKVLACAELVLGELTMDHMLPFHCSINVWLTPLLV
jgi:hypothetical protein